MWFTERAYHYDPEVEPEKYRRLENQIIKERSFYGTPNSFFEPEHGAVQPRAQPSERRSS
jgi:hypothetical protein